MSFGGRDISDSKRKNQWPGHSSNSKRFHGSSNGPREDFRRYHRGSRWDRAPPKTHNWEPFSKSQRSPGSSRESNDKRDYNRFLHQINNKSYNQNLDFQPSVSSGPPKESEDLSDLGADKERLEKVQATKKRIEEALASKSSNKEIHFQNSSTSSEGKSKDSCGSHGPNLDLRLTNSDFKEIGSVASAVPSEGDLETADFMNYASLGATSHVPQQRSFVNTTLNLPAIVQASQQKLQKVGGWSMSAVNDIVPDPNKSYNLRPRSEMYLQDQREEILGNVSTATREDTVDPAPSKQLNDNQNKRHEVSRVGRLYQSFLKSRLFGYTLKVSDKSPRLTGPNPLLDKSVLENQNPGKPVTGDKVLELQMPQPIRVKMENNEELNTENTPEHIAAAEANEFCQEYSYLLKDPNFLIPPDDLEKFGLGYLIEMNKLISDKRSGGSSESTVENQDSFFIRNSGGIAGSHIGGNVNKDPFITSHNIGQREIIDRFKERDRLLNNDISQRDSSSSPGYQNPPSLDQNSRPDVLRKDNGLLTRSPAASPFHNVSVEAVVEKVVKTILQPSNINTVLHSSNPATGEARAKRNESHLPEEPGTSFNNTKSSPLNQMQDVSSKILRLFLIDKQVEELMSEKMKIYSELLSSQGVSQTLFHSWAQDQIQQGNVMSVVSNTLNAIPELSRVINRNTPETNILPAANTQLTHNALEETISELYSLKKEYGNPDMTAPQTVDSSSGAPSMLPPDSCFLPPKDVVLEDNRPKLSVRKDLIDPNLSLSPLNSRFNLPVITAEDNGNQSDCTNSADVDGANTKREKKKKKSKKKDSVEVINLIEDTDDEISSGTGVASSTDDISKGLNSEDEVDKRDNHIANSKILYELDGKIATCMTIMKLKKPPSKVLVVGCKDGFVMVYALGNPAINFTKQIHTDTITSVFYTNKYLITGSADSTVCLFSLKEQVETQTLSVNAPVQSMDMNLGTLIVGTKSGSIYSYTVKINGEDKKKTFVSLHPNKKSLPVTNSSILAVKLAKEGVRRVLIVASRGEQVTVRDSTSGLLLRTFDWCDTVYCLQLYEETPFVYCGTNTKSVKVVNYTDGESAGDCMMGRSITQIIFHQSVMFAASYDGNIYVYDVEKKSLISTVIISKGIIQCLGVDAKSNVILVASSKGDLQQIPFPSSVMKHMKKLKMERKKSLNTNLMQP